jgi:Matrixin/Putative peptidoglycan binding domain
MSESAHDRYTEMVQQGYDADAIRDAPDVEPGGADPSVAEVQNFLKHYGYLDFPEAAALEVTPERLDDATVRALTEFQRRYNVGTPGTLDAPTRDLMAAPRCGVPDLLAGPSPFCSTRCAWNRRALTYTFGNLSDQVGKEVGRNAVRRAFRTWAAAGVGLSFRELSIPFNPDIFVEWRPAADPDHSMGGRTLAHADFPLGCSIIVRGLPLPLHFDDEEHTWVDGASGGFDIETIALHEIGHLLGLEHSDVSGSVMFAFVNENTTLRRLQSDDRAGIRALYPTFP